MAYLEYIAIGLSLIVFILLGLYYGQRFRSKKIAEQTLSSSLTLPKHSLVDPLKDLFFGSKKEIRELIPELEEKLLAADVGVNATTFLIESLQKAPVKTAEEGYGFIKKKVEEIISIPHSRKGTWSQRDFTSAFRIPHSANRPLVFFFVGVNGTGKTTTIGKLAAQLKEQGLRPLLVAADTFRAAAKDQLKIWAERSSSDFVGGGSGADPASVVFDGIEAAKARGCDVVLVDTAGRLQTKTNLMEELKKMIRVCQKSLGREPDEVFLILDATIGQNGLSQARVFLEAAKVTGLVLTKFDSTAKGGILLSVIRETGLPLRFVGVGERVGDLKPFEAHEFVESLFE